MIQVRPLAELSESDRARVAHYLNLKRAEASPFHGFAFASVLDDNFDYPNHSLAAFDSDNSVVGFVPQWRVGNKLDSVPWRDRGGPLFNHGAALNELIQSTEQLVKQLGLKGYLWKSFEAPGLNNYRYFVKVTVNLKGRSSEEYWNGLANSERATIRQAERRGLRFVECEPADENLRAFYRVFVANRRRLGVPVYPYSFFESLWRHYGDAVKLFQVVEEERVLSSLLLFVHETQAIDGFSASTADASAKKANDLMHHRVIDYCLRQKLETFDFGADSPNQAGLIAYKMKWLGKRAAMGSKNAVVTSYSGDVRESDHNTPAYEPFKKIFQWLPLWAYMSASRLVVR